MYQKIIKKGSEEEKFVNRLHTGLKILKGLILIGLGLILLYRVLH